MSLCIFLIVRGLIRLNRQIKANKQARAKTEQTLKLSKAETVAVNQVKANLATEATVLTDVATAEKAFEKQQVAVAELVQAKPVLASRAAEIIPCLAAESTGVGDFLNTEDWQGLTSGAVTPAAVLTQATANFIDEQHTAILTEVTAAAAAAGFTKMTKQKKKQAWSYLSFEEPGSKREVKVEIGKGRQPELAMNFKGEYDMGGCDNTCEAKKDQLLAELRKRGIVFDVVRDVPSNNARVFHKAKVSTAAVDNKRRRRRRQKAKVRVKA